MYIGIRIPSRIFTRTQSIGRTLTFVQFFEMKGKPGAPKFIRMQNIYKICMKMCRSEFCLSDHFQFALLGENITDLDQT